MTPPTTTSPTNRTTARSALGDNQCLMRPHSDTGEQIAVFDLAWPDGVQTELSQPVAVLLDEGDETLALAAKAGYRCFTRTQDFRENVATEISPAVGAVG